MRYVLTGDSDCPIAQLALLRGESVRIIQALRERDAVLRGLPDALHGFDLRLDVAGRFAGGGVQEIGDAGDDGKHDEHAHDT